MVISHTTSWLNVPFAWLALSLAAVSAAATPILRDVIIYGGTPAAITAAIQIKRCGKTVAIVYPQTHIGGLTTSGLSWTDSKDGNAIGGIAREFYENIYSYYDTNSTDVWKYGQSRRDYSVEQPQAQPGRTIDTDTQVQWTFEPHVALAVFNKMLHDEKVDVYAGEYLNRETGVIKDSGDEKKIAKICMLSGNCYLGKIFIDAGYEGDLMDAAGIPSSTGRDSKHLTHEQNAGMFLAEPDPATYSGVDPYVKKGDKSSGLLPGIETEISNPFQQEGDEDSLRLQSFNFRLTLTNARHNKVEIERPDNYDESQYELMLRLFEANHKIGLSTASHLPNRKIDANNVGEMGLDFVGGSYNLTAKFNYANASYDQREEMHKAHKEYALGFLYTLAHSERLPLKHRRRWARWGLSKDEYKDNDHFPYQLYVREARRMQSDVKSEFTMQQNNVQAGTKAGYFGGAVAALGSYSLDSHNARRVVQAGQILDEGVFYIRNPNPFPIPYRAMTPPAAHATNFLNPVTLSMSHVALGSIRMEPTYMILGQSAGIAAALAIDDNVAVQNIKERKLQHHIEREGQRTWM